MEILPAIDLHKGQCVRLTQGRFDEVTVYESSPMLQAERFASAGARWMHVVDLDGARDGTASQHDILASLASNMPLRLQVGGGIRDADTVKKLLDSGVERVVAGSLAVEDPPEVSGWMRRFGADRVVLAFDVKIDDTQDAEPEVLTRGWQSRSRKSLWDVLEFYRGSGLRNILCTDISRDGMMNGPNISLYKTISEKWPSLNILASGGVKGLADIRDLLDIGISGAIVGKALYEGKIDLAEALHVVA